MNPKGIVLTMPWFLVSGQVIPVLSSENYYGEEKAAKLTNPEIKLIAKGKKTCSNALKIFIFQDFSICFRFLYRQTRKVQFMFYQWKMEMDLTFEDETVLLTVKPQDQIVQPEGISAILKVKYILFSELDVFYFKGFADTIRLAQLLFNF